MAISRQSSDFFRQYNLADACRHGIAKTPAPHQAEALRELDKWYKSAPSEHRGGILVLPTGGSKTEARTTFEANFDEQEYEKWVGTHRDIPDTIIASLASSRERIEYIAGCYVNERAK